MSANRTGVAPGSTNMLRCRWLRALIQAFLICPAFSQPAGFLARKDARSYEGYDLVAPVESSRAYLVDSSGKIVHQWETTTPPALSTYLLPNGHLLRTAVDAAETSIVRAGSGAGGAVHEFDWEGNLVWSFRYQGADVRQHHDIAPLPNGNILMVAWERKTAEEAIAAGRLPHYLAATGGAIWPDHLIEVSRASGEIVWEWHVWDHLIQDTDPAKPNFGSVRDHPERIDVNFNGDRANPSQNRSPDWNHVNSVSYNEALDQIILSVPTFGEIWIIDHSTTTEQARGSTGGRYGRGGDLLYRWGNPQSYHAGTEGNRHLYFQHSAHWIPDDLAGHGNILIFDNGQGRPLGEYSRVLEIVPPVMAGGVYYFEGTRWGPAEPSWSYQHLALAARVRSGAQRLPNGNTLICDGVAGRTLEVTPAGDPVWEFTVSLPTSSIDPVTELFRVQRYRPGFPGLAKLNHDASPGLIVVNAAGGLQGNLAPGQLVLVRGAEAGASEIGLIDDQNRSHAMAVMGATGDGVVARLPPNSPIGAALIRSGDKNARVVIGSVAPGLFPDSLVERESPEGLVLEVKATGIDAAKVLAAFAGGRRVPSTITGVTDGVQTLEIGPVAGVTPGAGAEVVLVADGVTSNRIETPKRPDRQATTP